MSLQRIRRTWSLYSIVFISSKNVGERPRIINKLLEYKLLNYLKERPIAYLDEIAYFLLDEYSIIIDKVTV